MSPKEYVTRYTDLAGWLSNTEVCSVGIRKYLSNSDGNVRAKGAKVAANRILDKLKKEFGVSQQYIVDGWIFIHDDIRRVSWGKASPYQILDTFWLAYRYGLVTTISSPKPHVASPQQYADWYTGVDCNGFVDNYFGFTEQRAVSVYDRQKDRRNDPAAVSYRDVLITHDIGKDKKYCHIRLVAGPPIVKGDAVTFDLAESSGWQGIGVREARTTLVLKKGTNIFVDKVEIPGREYYIVPPPPEAGLPTL